MPSRRMIDPAFWQSETVASLNIEQRYLFIGLFSNADDQGRLRGHPALIRNIVFPYDEVALEQMERDLKALEAIGTIILYQVDGKTFIQIANWWKYQRPQWAYPSEFGAPKNWNDRLRYRAGGEILTHNWKGELDALDSGSGPDSPDDEPPPEQPSPNGTGHPLPEELPCIENPLPKPLPKDLPKPLAEGEKSAIGIVLESVLDSKEDEEESHVHEREEKVAKIMELYQNNITISVAPITAQEMLSDEFLSLPLQWWQEAVKIATDNNVRKWSYVRGILSRSIQVGLSPEAAGPPESGRKLAREPIFPAPIPPEIPEPEWTELTKEEQVLEQFKELARLKMSRSAWEQHVKPLTYLDRPNGRIRIACNRFAKEWLETRLNRILDPIAQELAEEGFEYVVT